MLRLNPNVIMDSYEEEDNDFLLDLGSGEIFSLNYFAALLVHFIEEKKTVDEYVEKVLEITNNDKEEADIREDARHYISHMLEMGLLFEE